MLITRKMKRLSVCTSPGGTKGFNEAKADEDRYCDFSLKLRIMQFYWQVWRIIGVLCTSHNNSAHEPQKQIRSSWRNGHLISWHSQAVLDSLSNFQECHFAVGLDDILRGYSCTPALSDWHLGQKTRHKQLIMDLRRGACPYRSRTIRSGNVIQPGRSKSTKHESPNRPDFSFRSYTSCDSLVKILPTRTPRVCM